MQPPRTPDDESERLEALQGLCILDTDPEERFDRYTRLARRLFGVPIALVSLVDADRQWFKSVQGLEATETPREISFCGHAILDEGPLVVSDATRDDRFHDNPLVQDDPAIRFYAGHPLRTPDGSKIGTLCVIDREPRTLDADDQALLGDLAEMVQAEFATIALATVDELTGLSNRRGFRAISAQAIAACRRRKAPATLVYLDLDGFKQINDEFGHAEGDRALTTFASLLLESFRESDIVSRIGGDEFAVLVVDSDAPRTTISIQRFEEVLRRRNAQPEPRYALAFSAGVVGFDPEKHATIEDLLAQADERMYAAKAGQAPGTEPEPIPPTP